MGEWIGQLRGALVEAFGEKPVIATLATVDAAGRPRARTVVCREISDEGRVRIYSDARSGKNGQILARGDVEMVIYLAGARQQFRLAGTARVSVERRREAWAGLTDEGRAMYFWPEPGEERRDGGEIAATVAVTTAAPESFSILELTPAWVEFLDVGRPMHTRRQWNWTQAHGWIGRDVNP